MRVDSDCAFTKMHGIHGQWDSIVTTEASLPVPVQLDVKPLAAVNAVIGVHPTDMTIESSRQWKEMSCSLHLASSSATGEEPEVFFRFFSHYPPGNNHSSLREPLIEGEVPVGSTLSFRVVPDTSTTSALLLNNVNGADSSNNNNEKVFCEVRLYLDGVYISSAFFPQKSQVRASCILSDPVGFPALQIIPRAPTTHLEVANIFLGATPLQSMLQHRRAYVKKMINQELNAAKPTTRGHSDAAHGDSNCSVLFVELKIDLSGIESLPGIESAFVSVNFYWRPTWNDGLPMWSVKCLGTAATSMLSLFSLNGSGRGSENFEEAPEKSKNSSLMMQM